MRLEIYTFVREQECMGSLTPRGKSYDAKSGKDPVSGRIK